VNTTRTLEHTVTVSWEDVRDREIAADPTRDPTTVLYDRAWSPEVQRLIASNPSTNVHDLMLLGLHWIEQVRDNPTIAIALLRDPNLFEHHEIVHLYREPCADWQLALLPSLSIEERAQIARFCTDARVLESLILDRDPKVLQSLGHNRSLPSHMIFQLIASGNHKVCVALAYHVQSFAYQKTLLSIQSLEIARALASNHHLAISLERKLTAIANETNDLDLLARLVSNPNTSLDLLRELADHPSALVRRAMTSHPLLPYDLISAFNNDLDPSVQITMLRHTRGDLFSDLGTEIPPHWRTHDHMWALASNPSVLPSTLHAICEETLNMPMSQIKHALLRALITNAHTPEACLLAMDSDKVEPGLRNILRPLLACHPELPPEIMCKYADREDRNEVISRLADNPRLTDTACQILMTRFTGDLYWSLISNPSTCNNHLETICLRSGRDMQCAAGKILYDRAQVTP
jgi:hypothetical protein